MKKRNILKITEKDFIKKFAIQSAKLVKMMQDDEMIYGDGYVEFTDRKIEVILPTRVTILHKKGKITGYEVEENTQK